MSEFFPKSKFLGANVEVELDLSNYATKADLKKQQELIYLLLLKKLIWLIRCREIRHWKVYQLI